AVDPGRALLRSSGGQDSRVCLAWALGRSAGVETVGLHSEQRHRAELEARPRVRERMKALAPAWAARLGEDHVLALGALAAISDTALTREVAIAIGESGAADDVRARPQSHLPRLRRRTRLSAWSQASR